MLRTDHKNCCNSLALAAALLVSSAITPQAMGQDTKTFPNSITPLPPPSGPGANIQDLEPETRNRFLNLHFSLATDNLSQLEDRVAKGETISPQELASKYS